MGVRNEHHIRVLKKTPVDLTNNAVSSPENLAAKLFTHLNNSTDDFSLSVKEKKIINNKINKIISNKLFDKKYVDNYIYYLSTGVFNDDLNYDLSAKFFNGLVDTPVEYNCRMISDNGEINISFDLVNGQCNITSQDLTDDESMNLLTTAVELLTNYTSISKEVSFMEARNLLANSIRIMRVPELTPYNQGIVEKYIDKIGRAKESDTFISISFKELGVSRDSDVDSFGVKTPMIKGQFCSNKWLSRNLDECFNFTQQQLDYILGEEKDFLTQKDIDVVVSWIANLYDRDFPRTKKGLILSSQYTYGLT